MLVFFNLFFVIILGIEFCDWNLFKLLFFLWVICLILNLCRVCISIDWDVLGYIFGFDIVKGEW